MEEFVNDSVFDSSSDFSEVIFGQFSGSLDEEHQHICSVMGSIAQSLKERGHPVSATACFLSACISLDSLVSAVESVLPSDRAIDSLLIIISNSLPSVSPSLLRKKMDYVSDIIIRAYRVISSPGKTSLAAAVAVSKCVAHLLCIRVSVDWNDVAVLYSILLGLLTDSRPDVRKQAQTSLHEVHLCLNGTSTLCSANDTLIKTFERFLLLAGGSQQGEDGGDLRGAREVLYILDAQKDCLPLMSMKQKATVLSYYKTLLQLRQPLVTKRVSDSLNSVCLHPDGAPQELLLDLLLLLAANSSSESSGDNLSFTARLLAAGMKKIYSLNRQLCVVKLPVIFGSLKDIFASEHGEAVFASSEAFRSIIFDCVDEGMIKQGVDQYLAGAEVSRRSTPTIIERICAIVESLLEYHYSAVWNMAFQVTSAMFEKLGIYSSYFMRETMKNLADMQKLPDEDFPYRKQLHECLGKALGAMGPEAFLSILPLNIDVDNLSEVNVWLFPIIKHHTVGARLEYFVEAIVEKIKLLMGKSQQLELQGRIVAARNTDALVYSLWSLLPSFCNYPLDTAECFKDLESVIKPVLRDQPDSRGMICSSLQLLINQNKRVLEIDNDQSTNNTDRATEKALAYYTTKVAEDNLGVLKSSSRNLLHLLAGILKESSLDDGGILQSTISEFASIADKPVVKKLFLKTMHDLLSTMKPEDASKTSDSLKRSRLFDLAATLVPGLDDDGIGVLLNAVKLGFKDPEGYVQKRAYKALSIILQKSFASLQSRLGELLQLMMDVMPLCHFSAKRHRIDCLYFLIVHFFKMQDNAEDKWKGFSGSFLTEIILALKETNKKTRNRAYDLLVEIGRACSDEERGGRKQNLFDVYEMISGGLAGETPHMISAALKGLARLAYEFSDLVSSTTRLLPFTYKILEGQNREVVKASLGFLKVLVAKISTDALLSELKGMVAALLLWQGGAKDHFKAKVKHILEMLVGRCGVDAVKAVVPDNHMRLLTNVRKIKERKKRKSGSVSGETRSLMSKATTSRSSAWNHTRIFSDSGESDGPAARTSVASKTRSKATSSRSRKMRHSDKSLPEDLHDESEEPLDLLDRRKTRSVIRTTSRLKRKQPSDDEAELDSEGRLIVHEGKKPAKDRGDTGAKSVADGGAPNANRKRRKTTASGWAYLGGEYGSKKAGGDVSKANKYEPYAYWPLDRKMISRRTKHRATARKGMASVVKMTKRLEGKSARTALSMKLSKFKKQTQRSE